jgi:hypothetical protein
MRDPRLRDSVPSEFSGTSIREAITMRGRFEALHIASGIRRVRTTSAALLTLAAVTALLTGPSPAHAATLPTGNLIANAGAEDSGATDRTSTVAPAAWTTTGAFTSVSYVAIGMPASVQAQDGGGIYLFAGGDTMSNTGAEQSIDVSSYASEIDAGGVSADLSGWLGGYSDETDAMTITAVMVDASGQTLGSLVIGPVTPAERDDQTTLLSQNATGAVLPGTRTIVLVMSAAWGTGYYNDAYADNLSLTLAASSGGPPPTTVATCTVPTVRGLQVTAAAAKLASAGCKVDPRPFLSDSGTYGDTLATSPSAGKTRTGIAAQDPVSLSYVAARYLASGCIDRNAGGPLVKVLGFTSPYRKLIARGDVALVRPHKSPEILARTPSTIPNVLVIHRSQIPGGPFSLRYDVIERGGGPFGTPISGSGREIPYRGCLRIDGEDQPAG